MCSIKKRDHWLAIITTKMVDSSAMKIRMIIGKDVFARPVSRTDVP